MIRDNAVTVTVIVVLIAEVGRSKLNIAAAAVNNTLNGIPATPIVTAEFCFVFSVLLVRESIREINAVVAIF